MQDIDISPLKRRSSSPLNPAPPKDSRIQPSTKYLQLTPPIFDTPSGDPEPKQKEALKIGQVLVFEGQEEVHTLKDETSTSGSVTTDWLIGCCFLAFVVGVASGLVFEAYKKRGSLA